MTTAIVLALAIVTTLGCLVYALAAYKRGLSELWPIILGVAAAIFWAWFYHLTHH